jgi:hypothetical protein
MLWNNAHTGWSAYSESYGQTPIISTSPFPLDASRVRLQVGFTNLWDTTNGPHTLSVNVALRGPEGATLMQFQASATFTITLLSYNPNNNQFTYSLATTGFTQTTVVGDPLTKIALEPAHTLPNDGTATTSGGPFSFAFNSDVALTTVGTYNHRTPLEDCTMEVSWSNGYPGYYPQMYAQLVTASEPDITSFAFNPSVENYSVRSYNAVVNNQQSGVGNINYTGFGVNYNNPPGTITTKEWQFCGGAGNFNGADLTGGPVEHDFIEGGTWPIRLTVIDNQFGWDRKTESVIIGDPSHHSAIYDHTGVMWCARNGFNILVERLPSGNVFRELKRTVNSAGTPTLFRHPGKTRMWLFYQSRTTNAWELTYTDDAFKTLSSPMPVWTADYRCAHICDTAGGGAASVALKKGTNPVEIWFRRSPDGLTWPDDDPAYAPRKVANYTFGIGAVTVIPLQIIQKRERGVITLEITDFASGFWYSRDMGRTWTLRPV